MDDDRKNKVMKVVVTGGSGFIGTNLIEHLLEKGYEVVNYDIQVPQISVRKGIWENIDLCDKENLYKQLQMDEPDYIVHLAARTDLNGKLVDDYSNNILSTQNLLDCVKNNKTVKKIIITSSMLVCSVGYIPKSDEDFCPTTAYGKSKVIAEKCVREANLGCDWAIIRPTSIWGPWFGTPYRDFFEMVIKRRYVHVSKRSSIKTYGYIGNAVNQIEMIMLADGKSNDSKVFYIGDYSPYVIEEWADEIAKQSGIEIKAVPFILIKCAAFIGDILKSIGIQFPMTSFRLKNMTTDNIIDMSRTHSVAGELPYSREAGIVETLKWMESTGK